MEKAIRIKKRPNPDDILLMPVKKVKVEKGKEIETLSDEMDKEDIGKSQLTVDEESSNTGDSNIRCHLERMEKITYYREQSSPNRISSTSIKETEEEKTNTNDSDEENVGSSYFEDEVLKSISSTKELSSLEQSLVSSKINTSISISDVSDISDISLSNNELNSDITEHVRNKQIKKIFNVFASMYKGFTAFKNNLIDYQKDIKEIMKLEGETLKDKEELEVFYSFIGLNMININCRVCSPCKPSSHLRKAKKSKSEARKETQPIGEVGNYHIYSRKFVKKLYTPEQLFEKGRVIKKNEKPLKYIFETFKSEDYADLSNSFTKPLYGKWQTKKRDSGFS
uniref:Rad4 beta-hairpin domain-containing protein n=1 Tax=Strongyloides stercoralis TaxID=6248 RepID=A0AAF5DRM6_STRER